MIDELVPDNIKQLRAYQPGKPIAEIERELGITDVIRISSNENAMGPSPRATAAAAAVLATVNAYPNGDCYTLRTTLCDRLGITPQELVFGSGSNEVIDLVVRAFCRPGIDEIVDFCREWADKRRDRHPKVFLHQLPTGSDGTQHPFRRVRRDRPTRM